jgi:hypothetical protein
MLARELGADILPVFIHGSGDVSPKGELVFCEGAVTVEITERQRPYEQVTAETDIEMDRLASKQMRRFYREHFAELREKLETPEYWRFMRGYQERYKLKNLNLET